MLIIVDSPISGDNRILDSINSAETLTSFIDINDKSTPLTLKDYFILLRLLVHGIGSAPWAVSKLRAQVFTRISPNPFSALKRCLHWVILAVQASQRIALYCAAHPNHRIHAHDLYCALAVALSGCCSRHQLTYNAHELEIHRNRKIGWFRLLLEYSFEQRVLSVASEVIVVNRAIKDLMLSWYKISAPIRIENNDFYQHHPVIPPPPDQPTAIVYVGMATEGRLLERLDGSPHPFGCDVHLYLLGKPLPPHISGKFWYFGPADYEHSLLELSRSKRCLMWCCLEIRSLSYQLATPNKFFQALAMGIPILASEGSYLADIVKKYDIGLVLDGQSEPDLTTETASPRFEQWVQNILNLREAILRKEIII